MKAQSTPTSSRPVKEAATTPNGEPSTGKRIVYFAAFATVIFAILAATFFGIRNGLNSQLNDTRHEGSPVADGVKVKALVSLNEEDAFPMGLAAAPDGMLYLSLFGKGSVASIDSSGALTQYLNAGTAAGSLIFASDGKLILFASQNKNDAGVLSEVSADKQLSPYGNVPVPFRLFSQLAFDAAGNLYVTNPSNGEVLRISKADGQTVTWWTAGSVGTKRAQVTGVAYNPITNLLLVSDSGTGSIYTLTVNEAAPTVNTLIRKDNFDARALAVDEQGRLLLATWENDNGSLLRLESDNSLKQLATGFREPSALVYQKGKAYIVNSDALALAKGNGIVTPKVKLPFTVDEIDLSAVK